MTKADTATKTAILETLMRTDLQRKNLTQIGRDRVTTIEATHRLHFPTQKQDAPRMLLLRLAKRGDLRRFQIGSLALYQLTRDGCLAVDAPLHAAAPLSGQALFTAFALLRYTSERPGARTRITPTEFAEIFPQLSGAVGVQPATQHYVVEGVGDTVRLTRVAVDLGATPHSLLRKVRRLAGQAAALAPLAELARADLFHIVLLVRTEAKRDRLLKQLQGERLGVVVRIVHVPGMDPLNPPIRAP